MTAASMSIAYLGDAAVAATMDGEDPLLANAQVHQAAAAVRAASVAGVRDVVPGMRELVVHIDPLHCDVPALIRVLETGSMDVRRVADPDPRPIVEVPVVYGGQAGPDLEEVASLCGLHADEVCARHAAVDYVVCFVGFLPGFPYLGLLDEALRVPRRASPRARVPAGAVAIAGEYSGIYPWASPGGWRLIGHTAITLFDPAADPPARLAPGSRVRFVPQ